MLVGVIVLEMFVFMCEQLLKSIIVASWIYRYITTHVNIFLKSNQGRLTVVQFAKSLQPAFYMLLILCDGGVSLCWLV